MSAEYLPDELILTYLKTCFAGNLVGTRLSYVSGFSGWEDSIKLF